MSDLFGASDLLNSAIESDDAMLERVDGLLFAFSRISNTEVNTSETSISSINSFGIPICSAGHMMAFDGLCKARNRLKWRCPLKRKKLAKNLSCDKACSTSPYGKTVYIPVDDDPRTLLRLSRF